MTQAASEPEVMFNPFAPGFNEDPYPHYAQLREREPVHEHPLGFWLLTDYADVSALLKSRMSVEEGNAGPSPMKDMFTEAGFDGRPGKFDGLMMLDRDPPDHTRLRKLVMKAFTKRTIDGLEPRITELVDEALDEIAAAGAADLVRDLAFPLPFKVIAEMLGTPETDHIRLRELSGLLVRSLEPVNAPEMLAQIKAAEDELLSMAIDMIAWKRRNPADDLLTRLIEAEDEGDKLSENELVSQLLLLYIAGHETTVNLIANGAIALLRHPDQLARLRAEPDLDVNAVEELLRYDSPVQMSRRVTVEPYEVGGRVIPAGKFVIASLASANRDPRVFGPDADVVRLDRPNARHQVAFGGGPHHCLGAVLARLEGRLALGRFVRRFERIKITGDLEWNGRINLRGLAKLPISVS